MRPGRPGTAPALPLPFALALAPLRHPALTAAARGCTPPAHGTEALAQARRALAVVRVLERHPLGVRAAQLGREAGLAGPELRPLLAMLCEEEYADALGAGAFARGPALDRLAAPGGRGLAGQLQRTLALARDSAGAAVYLSRYAEGEVLITQMADGPGTPPVREWVDFRAAAHASAVGKCLLTQLDHDGRADHVARHRPARLTPRTITDSRTLFSALDAVAPGAPVFDLREYSPGVVCSAVPLTIGNAAACLALSLPVPHAHRLRHATEALRRKAVPVLLALLLTGTIPPETGAGGPAKAPADTPVAAPAPVPRLAGVTPETLRHLRRLFRTPSPGRAPPRPGAAPGQRPGDGGGLPVRRRPGGGRRAAPARAAAHLRPAPPGEPADPGRSGGPGHHLNPGRVSRPVRRSPGRCRSGCGPRRDGRRAPTPRRRTCGRSRPSRRRRCAGGPRRR